jgi:hypothetical protein
MTTPVPQPKPKKRVKVEPEEGGQLEQFLVENKKAYDAATVADEDADKYKAAIKAWLLSLFPPLEDGTANPDLPDAFDIPPDPHGRYPGYTMTLKGGMRLDTDAIKQAGLYETYAKPTRPSWDLRESSSGRRRLRKHDCPARPRCDRAGYPRCMLGPGRHSVN